MLVAYTLIGPYSTSSTVQSQTELLFNITDRRAAGKYKYVICINFCVTLNQEAQQTKICSHLFKMLIVSLFLLYAFWGNSPGF